MNLEITDEEREALIFYLHKGIEADRSHFSPRLVPIKALLARLDHAQATRREAGDADGGGVTGNSHPFTPPLSPT
jgi:hypothetical protein